MNNFLKVLSNPFLERVKSPLIGPFIVSWSLFNWKVIYTTIFISNETLFPLNKLEYILNELNYCTAFIFPFLFTLTYIFLMPFIDRGLLNYTEEQKRKNLDLKLKIARKHSVDGEKYYSLKAESEKQKSEILKFETENQKYKLERDQAVNTNIELNNQIEIFQNNLKQVESSLRNLNGRGSIKPVLDGRWISYLNGVQMDDIEFQNNQYFIVKKDNSKEHVFDLVGVDLDIDRKRLTFTKFDVKKEEAKCFNDLRIIDSNRLEGTENRKNQIRYEKRVFVS